MRSIGCKQIRDVLRVMDPLPGELLLCSAECAFLSLLCSFTELSCGDCRITVRETQKPSRAASRHSCEILQLFHIFTRITTEIHKNRGVLPPRSTALLAGTPEVLCACEKGNSCVALLVAASFQKAIALLAVDLCRSM